MKRFTELLEEYLDLRDRLNSDYFDNRRIGERSEAREQLAEVAAEIDDIFECMEHNIATSLLTGKE